MKAFLDYLQEIKCISWYNVYFTEFSDICLDVSTGKYSYKFYVNKDLQGRYTFIHITYRGRSPLHPLLYVCNATLIINMRFI